MKRPRLSIRASLGLIALAALAVHLAMAAHDAFGVPDRRWIRHHWERRDDSSRRTTTCMAPPWSRFWRVALGLPWPGSFTCCGGPDGGDIELGIGVGTETRPHRYLGTSAVRPEDVWQIRACANSMKTLGAGIAIVPDDDPAGRPAR